MEHLKKIEELSDYKKLYEMVIDNVKMSRIFCHIIEKENEVCCQKSIPCSECLDKYFRGQLRKEKEDL